MSYSEKFEKWVATGASLYIRWCNNERLSVRQLSAIHNWVKRQLWAELDKENDDTSELRRLEDVLTSVQCDIDFAHNRKAEAF